MATEDVTFAPGTPLMSRSCTAKWKRRDRHGSISMSVKWKRGAGNGRRISILQNNSELITKVRRGIAITRKYLEKQENVDEMPITDTDMQGQNIFHLSIQSANLLHFLLKTFRNHTQLNEALRTEDIHGHTPVHHAVLFNEKAALQIFITHDESMLDVRSKSQQKTLIHCAVQSGSIYMVREIMERRPNCIFDKDVDLCTPALYAAALEEETILETFICGGVDTRECDDQGYTVLHVAAERGSLANVMLLLVHDIVLVNTVDKCQRTPLHIACKKNNYEIVEALLQNNANPFLSDEHEGTALDCAITNNSHEATETLLRSEYWKELIDDYKGGSMACFVTLVENMPNVAKVLLDHCYETSSDEDPKSPDFSVHYDFFLLEASDASQRKFDGLSTILKNRADECLKHNVTQKFLKVNWQRKGWKLYMTNLVVYLIFHILFNVYVVVVRDMHSGPAGGGLLFRSPMVSTKTVLPNTPSPTPTENQDHARTSTIVSVAILLTFTLLNMVKELFQMYFVGWNYLRQGSNYLEWILYISVLIVLFPISDQKSMEEYTAASVAVLLTWFNLILFMKRIPTLGNYILALQKVFMTLVKMLTIIVLFILAFASVFRVILAEHKRFQYSALAVLSTFVSMFGDFAYDDLFLKHSDQETAILYYFKLVVFLLFVLLICVVVNNVLIGLAVGDTDNVMHHAALEHLRLQASHLIQVETEMLSKLPWFHRKTAQNCVYVEYPYYEKAWGEKIKGWLFGGDMLMFSNEVEEEKPGNRGVSRDEVEKMFKVQLQRYYKKMNRELQELRDDVLDKIKLP